MSIIAKREGGKDFKPAPEGQWASVCCDVVDLGIVDATYDNVTKKKHKIRIVFQITETDPDFDDKPFIVSTTVALNMHEKGRLRPFLESWRGKAYTDEQADAGIDVELMVGVNAFIQIVHNTKGDKTYANISTIMRLPKEMVPVAIEGYVRVKDRQEGDAPSQPHTATTPDGDEYEYTDTDEDDLPF